ncbi:MAG: radical SAM protein, partial [Elusimicrobia bacterium]|nr:radical SAM protein [Elusimicrobiota bacterium]
PLAYAYLKISEGCNHKCSFCIIPRLRGKYQSRTVASLTDEAKVLADSGIKELILVAQDTTSYGKDLYNRFALDKLLKNLCNISGIKRVRLMYAYPSSITKNLLNVIADYQEICNYIDVPVQHISPDVLGAMNRPVNTRSIIYDIIKKLPKVALRTTFISGFPSETKKDFNELLSFAQEGHFMYAGVFAYSDETLAGSHKIRPKVSAKLATKRKIILEKAQQTIFANKVCSLLGTTQELFIESCVKSRRNYLIKGRVPCQAPTVDGITFLESPKPLKVPSVKKVVITGHEGYNIKAKLI